MTCGIFLIDILLSGKSPSAEAHKEPPRTSRRTSIDRYAQGSRSKGSLPYVLVDNRTGRESKGVFPCKRASSQQVFAPFWPP